MTFFTRFQGVFFSPQDTFKVIAERPAWLNALIILLIAVALFSYIVAPYAQKDNIQIFENSVKLKERMGEERFNQQLEKMRNPSKSGILLRSFLLSPLSFLIGALVSSLIILGLGRLTSSEGHFKQVFSAYLYANFIDKILGKGIHLFLVLTRKSYMQTTTSLALLFPQLEVTSSAFVVLSQIDFFQLWLFGILGYALSPIFKIELKKALFISYGFWFLKSLFYIALGLISLRFVR